MIQVHECRINNFDCLPLRVTQVGVNGKRRFDKEASFKKTKLLDRGLALLQPAIASGTQAKPGARSDIYGAIAVGDGRTFSADNSHIKKLYQHQKKFVCHDCPGRLQI